MWSTAGCLTCSANVTDGHLRASAIGEDRPTCAVTVSMPPAPLQRRARTRTGRRPAPPRPLVARLVLLALRALSVLPLRVLHAVGGALGAITSWIPAQPRRVTDINLRIACRDLDPKTRARLARTSLAQTGRAFFELPAVWFQPVDRILATVIETTGESCFADAAAAGRGVIVATLHLGSWELGLLHMGRRYDAVTMYRAPRIRELERPLTAARTRAGGTMLQLNLTGARTAIRTIERGGVVVFAADQDPGIGAGIFSPFFGLLTNTNTLFPRLVQRTGARVVIGWSERIAGARGFRLHFRPAGPGVYDPDLAKAADALNAEIESTIRTLPAQYLWSYKRFRIRPPGQVDLYRTKEGLAQALGEQGIERD